MVFWLQMHDYNFWYEIQFYFNPCMCTSIAMMLTLIFFYLCLNNAPINVKPAGGRRGIGRDFYISPKTNVKFPTPGQKCEVKCNWNSPPQEMICGQKFKYPYSRDRKIIQMPNPGFTGFSASPVYLHWPFRNSLGNLGEFQILTNR